MLDDNALPTWAAGRARRAVAWASILKVKDQKELETAQKLLIFILAARKRPPGAIWKAVNTLRGSARRVPVCDE